jgi:AraC-like DNA-binding protein
MGTTVGPQLPRRVDDPPPDNSIPRRTSDRLDLVNTAERTIVDLRDRGVEPIVAVGGYRYLRAHPPPPPQRHRSLVVVVLPIRGTFDYRVDNLLVTLRPRQALVISRGRQYAPVSLAESRGELAWVIARCAGTTEPVTDLDRAVRVLAAVDDERITFDIPGELAADVQSLTQPVESDTWPVSAVYQHRVAIAMLRLAQATEGDATGQPLPSHLHRIRRVIVHIQENLGSPLRVADLASVGDYSVSQFHAVFRDVVGTSPMDYVTRERVERAAELLAQDNPPAVTSVAHDLGFASSQHFATVFRRYQGSSPSQVRRRGLSRSPTSANVQAVRGATSPD